jgi:hypothetical protein
MPRTRGPAMALLLTIGLLFPEYLPAQPRPAKKIVEYGWDVPYPDFVRDNSRAMEKHPFPGLL